ncbi:MAG: glycosyltransferase family 2 protein [Ferruginibacter sp.]|nr:glycosyltransferase family 2 protein [Ferruginibacter sp.]
MKLNNFLVSIITPVYNRANLLKDTAASVLAQKYPEWEWIIVDDGSTDDTTSVGRLLEMQDSRIRFMQRNREPRGACACRNIAMENARGEFLIFLDSDDLLAPFAIQNRIQKFEAFPQFDFMVYSTAFFQCQMLDANAWWNVFTKENDLVRFARGEAVWHTTGPIWRRSFLVQNNLQFDENLMSGQDWDFHVSALLKNPVYKKIDELPDAFVRRGDEKGRISQDHFSVVKFENRMNKLLQWTREPHFLNDSKLSELLCVNIAKECLHMIVKKKCLPEQMLNRIIQSTTHVRSFTTVWKYLYYANGLQKRFPIILSLYNKVFYSKWVGERLSYENKYRYPINTTDRNTLYNSLKLAHSL